MNDEQQMPEMDWQQVMLNGGPPCFFFVKGDARFCGRAERWQGHGIRHSLADHQYVSLADLLAITQARGAEIQREADAKIVDSYAEIKIKTGVDGDYEGSETDHSAGGRDRARTIAAAIRAANH